MPWIRANDNEPLVPRRPSERRMLPWQGMIVIMLALAAWGLVWILWVVLAAFWDAIVGG